MKSQPASNPSAPLPEPATDWLTPAEAAPYLGYKTAHSVRNLFTVGTNTPWGRVTLRFIRVGKQRKTRVVWVGEYLRHVADAFEDPPVYIPQRETESQFKKRAEREYAEAEAVLNGKRRGRKAKRA